MQLITQFNRISQSVQTAFFCLMVCVALVVFTSCAPSCPSKNQVCGENAKTYANECQAQHAGVRVVSQTSCEADAHSVTGIRIVLDNDESKITQKKVYTGYVPIEFRNMLSSQVFVTIQNNKFLIDPFATYYTSAYFSYPGTYEVFATNKVGTIEVS
jgi:hypothetical protein